MAETQYRVRMFWRENNEEVELACWPVVTTDKRAALVLACDDGTGTYQTLETRECPDWEPLEVPTAREVRQMIDSGELP